METWNAAVCDSGCAQEGIIAQAFAPTLRHAIDFWAQSQPEKTAYIDGRGERTYAQMACFVNEVEAALLAAGLAPGERIVTSLPAGMTFAALLFASMRIGVNLVPFDLLLSEADVERRLDIVKPRMVFASQASHLQTAADEGFPSVAVALDFPGCGSLQDFLAGGDPAALEGLKEADLQGPTLTIFTSGSTGNPKGVLLSEFSCLAIPPVIWGCSWNCRREGSCFPKMPSTRRATTEKMGCSLVLCTIAMPIRRRCKRFRRCVRLTRAYASCTGTIRTSSVNVLPKAMSKRLLWVR